MDTQGLWQLFFQTGHPGIWLAIRQEEEMLCTPAEKAKKREKTEKKSVF